MKKSLLSKTEQLIDSSSEGLNQTYSKDSKCTEVFSEDREEMIKDELGVIYNKDCTKLLFAHVEIEAYDIKNGTKIICDNAFEFDLDLKEVTIPDTVTSIGKSAFSECKDLEEIILPGSIKKIGNRALSGCSSLKRIIIPQGQISKFSELLQDAYCDLSIIVENK